MGLFAKTFQEHIYIVFFRVVFHESLMLSKVKVRLHWNFIKTYFHILLSSFCIKKFFNVNIYLLLFMSCTAVQFSFIYCNVILCDAVQYCAVYHSYQWNIEINLFSIIFKQQWWANIMKWTQTNIRIYSDATLCTEWISEHIRMQHIYRTNTQIYSYSGNSTNMNTNNILGSFYSNIRIFILITDKRIFLKGPTLVSSK